MLGSNPMTRNGSLKDDPRTTVPRNKIFGDRGLAWTSIAKLPYFHPHRADGERCRLGTKPEFNESPTAALRIGLALFPPSWQVKPQMI